MSLSPPRISFQALTSRDPGLDLSGAVEQAFGLDGFGAVIVTGALGSAG
ncbi:MAG: hypothetical protein H6740_12130 [Alphaproteobacteria bacterium]|nr:hypothetical protein [Alphaproteobacteria bacterium]